MTITIRKLHLAVAIAAVAMLIPATAVATHIFTDVPDGAFYSDPVEWAFNNEITTGKSPTQFAPLDDVTRGESVTFLKRYDDNIVQPALADLESQNTDLESQITDLESEITDLDPAPGTRAAHATSVEIDESIFVGGAADLLTTTITAPASGMLVIGASVDASGTTDDQYVCEVTVDDVSVVGSRRTSRFNWQGVDGVTDRTDNSQEDCSTDAVTVVDAGAHTVDFRVSARGTAAFHSATLWALWVPFDGNGDVPSP